MELNNEQVLNAVPVLRELIKQKVPIKVSFKILTVVERLEEIIRVFEMTKQTLVTDYTERDEEGNAVPFVDEDGNSDPNRILIKNPEEFQNSLAELLSAETEVDIPQIEIDDLGDISIEPEKLLQLRWLFVCD